MLLSCPSCQAQYESAEYINAFEINCVCGYSILVPQEFVEATAPHSKQKIAFDAAVPTAMDAEDEGLLIRPEGLDALDPEKKISESGGGVLDMTAPEDLPGGLVYDPFELPNVPAVQSSDASDFSLGNVDVFTAQNSKKSDVVVSKSQILVTRSQLASMGNFLGSNFEIRLEDLKTEDLQKILQRLRRILGDRPWLESELRRRKINLEDLAVGKTVTQIPEVLAMEVYLMAFEYGGRCSLLSSEP